MCDQRPGETRRVCAGALMPPHPPSTSASSLLGLFLACVESAACLGVSPRSLSYECMRCLCLWPNHSKESLAQPPSPTAWAKSSLVTSSSSCSGDKAGSAWEGHRRSVGILCLEAHATTLAWHCRQDKQACRSLKVARRNRGPCCGCCLTAWEDGPTLPLHENCCRRRRCFC